MGPGRSCRHPSMLGLQDVLPNTSGEHEYPTTVSLAPALSLGYSSKPSGARVINCSF